MKIIPKYDYKFDNATHIMSIFEDDKKIADIPDCDEDNLQLLFREMVWELRGIDINE